MNAGDIVALFAVGLIVAFALFTVLRSRKSGHCSGCSCGCEKCGGKCGRK